MPAPPLLLLAGLGLLFASKKKEHATGALASADDSADDGSTDDSTAPPAPPHRQAPPPPPAAKNGATAGPTPVAPPGSAAPHRPPPPDFSHPHPTRPRPAWVDAWLAAHPRLAQRRPPPPPRSGAPARPRPAPPVPHPAVLAQQVASLPPHLRPGAQIALQSGRPHLAARIAEGAMRGESAESIAQNIAPHLSATADVKLPGVSATLSAPDIGSALAQVFGQ